MTTLSDEDVNNVMETFSLFDDKGDERILVKNFGNVVRALGLNPGEAEIYKVTEHIKAERMVFEEFLPCFEALVRLARQTPLTLEELTEGLKVFDREGNGYISSAELRHVLTTLGEQLTDDEVEILLAGFDDKNGNIRYEDWLHAMMTGQSASSNDN